MNCELQPKSSSRNIKFTNDDDIGFLGEIHEAGVDALLLSGGGGVGGVAAGGCRDGRCLPAIGILAKRPNAASRGLFQHCL